MTCTVTKTFEVVPGTRDDYNSLSHFHYRESHLGPCAAIFALRGKFRNAEHLEVAGVIIYSMPTAGAQMRNIATDGIFVGLDKRTQLKLINKNIRTISRVIIEPRFRSLGLAVRLVRETMPLMNVPFIEALAVMGRVNPFFEKAGLTRYDAPVSVSCVRLIEAFSSVGINEEDLIDAELVQQKLDSMRHAFVTPAEAGVQKARQLDSMHRIQCHCERSEAISKHSKVQNFRGTQNAERSTQYAFIKSEIARFLQSYGRRRFMPPGIDRTKFLLSKLTDSPVYYIWRNPNIELRT